MASGPAPRDRADFSIVLVCAKKEEAECARDALDKKWNDKQYGKHPSDNNAYTLGSIGDHHVVIIHMPGMGTDRAAVAKTSLDTSFPNIKLTLVVGVCGGMPYGPKNEEIILGDVVISDALVRYDLGRQYPQMFEKKTDIRDALGSPTEKILSVIRKLETREERMILQSNTVKYLNEIQEKSPDTKYPSSQKDILYDSAYIHQHRPPQDCDICQKGQDVCQAAVKTECEDLKCCEDTNMCVQRSRLAVLPAVPQPAIHFGPIASGNSVMKSGYHRDMLAKEGVLAIEMEGAGVWKYGPTIVIKSVCDYGDSHKRKGWQQYAAATAAACMKAFLIEWVPERRQNYPDAVEANAYFDIPDQRVKSLYGRKDELTKIAAYFDDSSRRIDRPRMLVLQALGGQGKTQIALEHCYCTHTHRTHHGIFWLDGSSNLATTKSWVAVAKQIDESNIEALSDDDARVRFAIHTLEKWDRRWLVVFDNCDDPTSFSTLRQKLLPKVGKGEILFTSRHHGLGELGALITIPPLSDEAGVQLLLHRYGNDIKNSEYMVEGVKIVERLGGLALAIDQASAFMDYRQLPLDQLHTFLPLYLAQREKVLEHTTSDLWNYIKIRGRDEQKTAISAFTTWEMSFQQLLDQHVNKDDVTHFFSLSAFFGSTFVDESLFKFYWELYRPLNSWMKLFSDAPEKMPSKATVPGASQDDIRKITPTYVKHTSRFGHLYRKMIRRVGNSSHKSADRGKSSPQAIEITATGSVDPTWSSDSFWHLIRQAHQMSLIQDISATENSGEASFLFHPLIRDWLQLRLALEHRQALIREATHILCSSVEVYNTRGSDALMKATLLLHIDSVIACDNEFFSDEHRLGCDISTCDSTIWIASFCRDQGKYIICHNLNHRVLATRGRVLGKEHPHTLLTINNLALALSDQGKYSEAEEMYRQVLEVDERILRKEHPDILLTINNLATVLYSQGKYGEAEEIHHQVLEVRERILGKEHPDTLLTINNLALVLSDQGKYSQAEETYRQVLEVGERILGKEHPNTLFSMNNLATVLHSQGKYGEAEEIHHQVLEVRERILGKEHPDTLLTISNLALVLSDQGRYSQAKEMYRQVLEVWERILGKEHPDTLSSMNNLALVLSNQGKYGEAEEIHRQVVRTRERVLGKEHPDTLSSMNNLAVTVGNQGNLAEAERILVPVLRSSLVVLGPQHPHTKERLGTLEWIWEAQGREESEIERMLQDITGGRPSG